MGKGFNYDILAHFLKIDRAIFSFYWVNGNENKRY